MSFLDLIRILLLGFPVTEEFIDPSYPLFLQSSGGLYLSLVISVFSVVFGAGIGALWAVGREFPGLQRLSLWEKGLSCSLDWVIRGMVAVIQGLPIMLLVMLFFYVPYPCFGVRIPAVILAIAAFSLYAASYLCEVFRSGFKSVPEGMIDASRVMGLSERQIWLHVRFPIITRVMLPSLVGIAITIFKDTSVLMVVGVAELTFTSRQVFVSSPAHYGMILFLVVAAYWGIAAAGSLLARNLEKRIRVRGCVEVI